MSGGAPSASQLALPTFLIGPQAGGRSYTLLKTPAAVARSASASDRLGDLALSLHRWSRSGEAGFVAFLPLDEGQGLWTLMRAASLGASELGAVALLHGAVLHTNDLAAIGWAAHRLAGSLAAPTYAMAGGAANSAEVLQVAPPTGAAVLGVDQIAHSLAHTDRVVGVPGDAEAEPLLLQILEAAFALGRRVEGWSAGGLLQRNGRFDPAAVFRLAVVSQPLAAVAAALPNHAPAELVGGRLQSADMADPVAWSAWQGLFGVKAREYRIDPESDARLAALSWRAEFRDLAPEEVVRRQTVEACAGLDPIRPIAVLHRLALAADKLAEPELAHAARLGLALAFGDLLRPDAATAAGQIEGYLAYVQPHLGGVLPAQAALLALDTGAMSCLPVETVAALTRDGVARGLFEPALAFLNRSGALDAAQGAAMLEALVHTPPPRATPAYRELLIRLVEAVLPAAPGSAAARGAALTAIEAADLAGDIAVADRICEPLWALLHQIRAGDADYRRAVAIGHRLAASAHAVLRAPRAPVRPVRLLQWAVRLTNGRGRARAA